MSFSRVVCRPQLNTGLPMFQNSDFLSHGSNIYCCWKTKMNVVPVFKWFGVATHCLEVREHRDYCKIEDLFRKKDQYSWNCQKHIFLFLSNLEPGKAEQFLIRFCWGWEEQIKSKFEKLKLNRYTVIMFQATERKGSNGKRWPLNISVATGFRHTLKNPLR